MRSHNRYEGIDEFAVAIIRNKARHLVGRYGFTDADVEDLEQELVIDFWRRMGKYDPGRGNKKAFTRRLINNRVSSLVRQRFSRQRDWRLTSSLNVPVYGQAGDRCERLDLVREGVGFDAPSGRSCSSEHSLGLVIDLRRVMDHLPVRLSFLGRGLLQKSLQELSEESGLSRAKLRRARLRLRDAFLKAGMDQYLKRTSIWTGEETQGEVSSWKRAV